jgi:hypothetical protein
VEGPTSPFAIPSVITIKYRNADMFITLDPRRGASGARFPDVEWRRRRLYASPSARVSVRGSHQKVSGERQMAIEIVASIKTIKYRDVDYETAKKEVMGYFQGRGEAYPSEIEEYLELDYKLICQIVDELKSEGRLEAL